MRLFKYNKQMMVKFAKELDFIRDTLEKVLRLSDILRFINNDPILSKNLALKGGTAINMTIFNLPRLSVDIDLDYIYNDTKEVMMEQRKVISESINKYMIMSGFELSPKSKSYHSLDSYIYSYINTAGVRDNIKIEINYSLRCHILPIEQRVIETLGIIESFHVNSLAAIEIFGSKIVELLTRAAARDLYDINNMIYYGLFDESELPLLRKCVVFYFAICGKASDELLDFKKFDDLTEHKIKADLYPTLRKKVKFDLAEAKKRSTEFLSMLLRLTDHEKEFLRKFSIGEYCPELIFEDTKIIERISNHPMALWKTR